MKIVIKFFTILISLILITAAAGVALLAFPVFGNQALIVRSGSMEPGIPVGSVVVVRPAENTSLGKNLYEVGQIISFRRDANTIVTHRVVEIEKTARGYLYITKGDANEEADNWKVKEENILGKNYLTIPEFGKLLAFARSEYGFPLLIILPAVFVILMEFVNIISEIFKYKNKKQEGKITKDKLDSGPGDIMPQPKIAPNSYFTKRNFFALKIFLPLIMFGAFFQSTAAFFSDTKTSPNNIFQAASDFPTTPTPTEVPNNVPQECRHIRFSGEPIVGTELDDKISGTPNNDLIFVFTGNNTVKGGAGSDCIVATGGFNMIDGDSGNDVIITGSSSDEIFGGSGDDLIISNLGDDNLYGGSGNDHIIGGEGNDTIDGGTGSDTCEGEELRRCE